MRRHISRVIWLFLLAASLRQSIEVAARASTTSAPPVSMSSLPAEVSAASASPRPPAATFDHTHRAFADILRDVVVRDRVDYARVRSRLSALRTYTDALAQLTPAQLEAFTRDQQLAFWINAYNAHILEVVGEAGTVASIRDIPEVFTGKPFTVAGQRLTFDRLENEVIRARFKEPRIHFMLNCAAVSCPPLQAEPARGERLEAQLEAAAAAFVRNPQHNRLDATTKTLYLSKIFEWFGADFVERYGVREPQAGLSPPQSATLQFVRRYLDGKGAALLEHSTPKISYLEYDWRLNSAPPR